MTTTCVNISDEIEELRPLPPSMTRNFNPIPFIKSWNSKELLNSPMQYYVDKSMFIKEFLELKKKFVHISRPPKWGKSTNLQLLREFLEILNREEKERVFSDYNLLIMKEVEIVDNYFCQFPIIYLDFEGLCVAENNLTNLSQASNETKQISMILACYERYRIPLLKYCETVDPETEATIRMRLGSFPLPISNVEKSHLITSLMKDLVKYLNEIYNRNVFIFIDHYDHPFHLNPKRKLYCVSERDMKNFSKVLVTLEGVEKILLMGITTIDYMVPYFCRESFVTDEKFTEFCLIHPNFLTSFGFTNIEVKQICQFASDDFTAHNQICEFLYRYYGYKVLGNSIFHPAAVIQFFSEMKCKKKLIDRSIIQNRLTTIGFLKNIFDEGSERLCDGHRLLSVISDYRMNRDSHFLEENHFEAQQETPSWLTTSPDLLTYTSWKWLLCHGFLSTETKEKLFFRIANEDGLSFFHDLLSYLVHKPEIFYNCCERDAGLSIPNCQVRYGEVHVDDISSVMKVITTLKKDILDICGDFVTISFSLAMQIVLFLIDENYTILPIPSKKSRRTFNSSKYDTILYPLRGRNKDTIFIHQICSVTEDPKNMLSDEYIDQTLEQELFNALKLNCLTSVRLALFNFAKGFQDHVKFIEIRAFLRIQDKKASYFNPRERNKPRCFVKSIKRPIEEFLKIEYLLLLMQSEIEEEMKLATDSNQSCEDFLNELLQKEMNMEEPDHPKKKTDRKVFISEDIQLQLIDKIELIVGEETPMRSDDADADTDTNTESALLSISLGDL